MKRKESKEVFFISFLFVFLIIISFCILDYLSFKKGQKSLLVPLFKKIETKEKSAKQKLSIQDKTLQLLHKLFPSARIKAKEGLYLISQPYSKRRVEKIKDFCEKNLLSSKVFISEDRREIFILCEKKGIAFYFLLSGIKAAKKTKTKISIVIDDVGNNRDLIKFIGELDPKLTPSILPFRKFSRWADSYLTEKGFEVILHLPMQPFNSVNNEPKFLKVGTPKEGIKKFLEEALSFVPHAKGINNHEGSLYTSSLKDVKVFLEVLKEKGNLFFLDSRTSQRSVAFEIALKLKIPTVKRDIFIDNKKDRKYIKNMLNKLLEISRKKGYAIGICHANFETLTVLKEFLKNLPKEVELVRLKELLLKP